MEKNYFSRGADKIKELIEENSIDVDDVIVYETTHAVAAVQQMGPNGMEIDLPALNDEVKDGDASRTTNLHPKQGQCICQSQEGSNKSWNILTQKVSGET